MYFCPPLDAVSSSFQVKIVTIPSDDASPPGTEGSIQYDVEFASTFEWALKEIIKIQTDARNSQDKPRWPMIVLRSPKGWGGPKIVDGKHIEGSFHSHQSKSLLSWYLLVVLST
jgi:hypothetical protein